MLENISIRKQRYKNMTFFKFHQNHRLMIVIKPHQGVTAGVWAKWFQWFYYACTGNNNNAKHNAIIPWHGWCRLISVLEISSWALSGYRIPGGKSQSRAILIAVVASVSGSRYTSPASGESTQPLWEALFRESSHRQGKWSSSLVLSVQKVCRTLTL